MSLLSFLPTPCFYSLGTIFLMLFIVPFCVSSNVYKYILILPFFLKKIFLRIAYLLSTLKDENCALLYIPCATVHFPSLQYG